MIKNLYFCHAQVETIEFLDVNHSQNDTKYGNMLYDIFFYLDRLKKTITFAPLS